MNRTLGIFPYSYWCDGYVDCESAWDEGFSCSSSLCTSFSSSLSFLSSLPKDTTSESPCQPSRWSFQNLLPGLGSNFLFFSCFMGCFWSSWYSCSYPFGNFCYSYIHLLHSSTHQGMNQTPTSRFLPILEKNSLLLVMFAVGL